MPRAVSERTLKMMSHFMEDHQNGMTNTEIAKKYNLDYSTVMKNLQAIADKNGVSRDSLLIVVQKPHIASIRIDKPVEPIDTSEIDQNMSAARAEIDKLQQSVRDSIDNCLKFECI